jgi:hypothetical protein
MTTTRRFLASVGLLVPGLVVSCVLVAGCAQGGQPGPGASGSSPAESSPARTFPAATPTVIPPDPAITGRTGGPTPLDVGTVAIRGTMIEGVEANCKIMRADDGTVYELVDLPPEYAQVGLRLEVRGRVETELMSICMQGTMFKVSSARRI